MTRSPRQMATIALALAAATAAPANAQNVSFSAYGTLGAAHSSEDGADYLVDAFKPSGPGRSHRWSADVDSRLGGQVSATFVPGLTGVVQVLMQQRYDDTYTPTVEWANVKYEVVPDWSVRAGRTVLSIFLVTDSRRVGYANPWVRPPVEVYGLVPVTNCDGADTVWRLHTPSLVNTLQLTTGRSVSHFPAQNGVEGGTAKAKSLFAVTDTVEHGAFTLKLTYGLATLDVDTINPLFDAFRQFGPAGNAIADRYDVRGRRVDFFGVGASYDSGPWLAMAEWARFDTDSVLGARYGWYVTGGRRFGAFTPYATYSRGGKNSNTSDPGLPLAGLPAQVVPVAATLNATLNQLLGVNLPRQRTVSAGVRWDFMRNVALKVQYDDVKPDSDSFGTFGQRSAGFQPGTRVRLFSALVDFVF